jgi:hypothetical protein
VCIRRAPDGHPNRGTDDISHHEPYGGSNDGSDRGTASGNIMGDLWTGVCVSEAEERVSRAGGRTREPLLSSATQVDLMKLTPFCLYPIPGADTTAHHAANRGECCQVTILQAPEVCCQWSCPCRGVRPVDVMLTMDVAAPQLPTVMPTESPTGELQGFFCWTCDTSTYLLAGTSGVHNTDPLHYAPVTG